MHYGDSFTVLSANKALHDGMAQRGSVGCMYVEKSAGGTRILCTNLDLCLAGDMLVHQSFLRLCNVSPSSSSLSPI